MSVEGSIHVHLLYYPGLFRAKLKKATKKTSVRTADFQLQICTMDLPNMKECYHLTKTSNTISYRMRFDILTAVNIKTAV
jgi:hypothetical protein